MCRHVAGDRESDHTRPPHGGSVSRNRPGQYRGDWGVCAALWGGTGSPIIPDPPNGASLSPKRPRHERRDLGVSAAVWGETGSPILPHPPTWRPYPPAGRGKAGGTRVYPPMCFGGRLGV